MVGSGVPAEVHSLVQVQARRDLAVLDNAPPQPAPLDGGVVELIAALHRVAAETMLTVQLTGPTTHQVPAHVARAITGAVGELLTNVTRHAGVAQVRIDVCAAPADGVEVIISDTGVGFATGQVRGRGLQHSVIGRMERLGGHATISGAPGSGSTATLRWQAP